MSLASLRRSANLLACMAGLAAAVPLSSLAQTAGDAEVAAREQWRDTIARTPTLSEGCFEADYPATAWRRTSCVEAPDRVYVPRSGNATNSSTQTVGNGHDYAATVTGVMSASVGSFPVVTGVTSERDGRANVYSIQLNSNFMSTPACNGISGCLAWEQFVYSSSERSAFMQYWLIDYGTCPAGGGWNSYQGSCYKNSAAVRVPTLPISNLSSLKLSGTAVNGGNDTLVFTTPTKAYSTSGADSVTYLATAWNQSEFNIVGDGGGSAATFNKGSSITVKVGVTNGSTAAPTCAANAGTTGETNNLNLGACTGVGGASPYIQFVQSN